MYPVLRSLLAPLLITMLCAAPGCDRAPREQAGERAGETIGKKWKERGEDRGEEWVPEIQGEYPIDAYDNYIETGDLAAIKKRDKLRILVDISTAASLPRAATLQDIEINGAKRLAARLGLEPVVLYVNQFEDLIPLLNEGKGDMIGNTLITTEERENLLDFSTPTASIQLVLVSAKDSEDVKEGDDLSGKTLWITDGATYETKAREFARQHPGLKLEFVDRNYVDLTVDVAQGKVDFTIVAEPIFEQVTQFRDDLKKDIVFPEKKTAAIAVRKNSPQLLQALNDEIRHIKLTRSTDRFTGDLDQIKERGVLRAVTRNTTATYFMWKGRVLGYEYELLEKFAKKLGVRLEIIVAPEHDDFVEKLNDGKADIAANLLSITERRKQQGMAFSTPYLESGVGIVARKGEQINSLDDLAGRTIHVRKSSSQYDVFQELQQKVPEVKLQLVPEELNAEQIIDKVADKEYDLAIVDEVSVKLERTWRDDIYFAFDLQDDAYAWMLRNSNPQLLAAINEFFGHKKANATLRSLHKKYFDSPKRSRPEITKLTAKGKISPYDDIVQKYSQEYDFDWRLVTAQMFQESTFNPRAKSWVGARGLMQVMPDTGKQVGESNLYKPENSVRAGLKYLEWLHEKFVNRENISPENRMWFTLAAYNAGLGHVYDAKDLAEEKGWDRKVWFGNVEKAMLLLADRKYYKKARYGYARGQEPVDYVHKIEARFRTYVALLDAYQRQQQVSYQLPDAGRDKRGVMRCAYYTLQSCSRISVKEPLNNPVAKPRTAPYSDAKLKCWDEHFETVGYMDVSDGATGKYLCVFEMFIPVFGRPEPPDGVRLGYSEVP